jgi:hypothetical protein
MINIKPIKLLRGSYADTGTTGQGCVMNVIAYLNGEPQITDKSECVCYVLRPLFIWFNDFLKDEDRHILIPYILRAMGSATDDPAKINRRLQLVVGFAQRQADYAKSADYAAEYAAKYAAEYAAEYAESAKSADYAAKSAADYAAKSTKSAAEYAKYAAKYDKYYEKTKTDFMTMLDEYLPKIDAVDPIVQQRIEQLESLNV